MTTTKPELWRLTFIRDGVDASDDEMHDFHVWGPPPITTAEQPRDSIPADVRAWAQMIGATSASDWVRYALVDLVDVTGYAETKRATTDVMSTLHGEKIQP